MYEDLTRMDKKFVNRSAQPQSKATAVDCKKTGDSTHKPWPRHNKKREGSSGNAKYEARKSSPAQRGRGPQERRPRTRDSNFSTLGGAENPGLAEDEPELGSVFVPGSKKQSLNHLLNFVYTPRGSGAVEHNRPSLRRSNVPVRVNRPLDHALYLQASCQFIVKEGVDYSLHLIDPDVPIKWDLIEEIVVRGSGVGECPVCLGPPVAGRVSRCGHVHCWPCALHYGAVNERTPPPCPVCAAPFRIDQMRPARVQLWEQPPQEISMRLVRRLRGSTLVQEAPPRGYLTSVAPASPTVQPCNLVEHKPYAKIFTANNQQVREIMERERRELNEQIMKEIDTSEIAYIEQALKLLEKKENELDFAVKPVLQEAEVPAEVVTVIEKQDIQPKAKLDWFDVDENDEATKPSTPSTEDLESFKDLTIENNLFGLNPDAEPFSLEEKSEMQENVEFPLVEDSEVKRNDDDVGLTDVDKDNQAKYFYFYQAADGQQVFLHSVNVRLLVASWGALTAAPRELKARVLRRDTASLTDQSRKHMPCAAHLPLHCPFEVVELDLQPPHVSEHALNIFSEELSRRARTRARLEREERRRERAARRALDGPPRPDLYSEVQFPSASSLGSPPAYGNSPPFVPGSPPTYLVANSPPAVAAPEPSPSSSGLSFAKMAGAGGNTWRVRDRGPSPPPPPPVDLDDAEGAGAPRALSLSDAIEAALHATPQPRDKQKKKKHKVLFSTGMQRTN